jgi:hypothetical protein
MENRIVAAISNSQANLQQQLQFLAKSLDKAKGADLQANILQKWQSDNQASIGIVLGTLTEKTEELQRKVSEQRYLDSLYFVQIKERRYQVAEAHKKTFKWVFDKRPDEIPWRDFGEWFSSKSQEDSFYWIAGKPGSGKSTLMRYIYDDTRTRTYLQKWAGARKLLIADCFFWNPGTALQKSQSGLLRSLLYELLKNCPQVIPIISPWRWRSYDLGASGTDPWTDEELKSTLQELAKATTDTGYSVCLFVDGLDEFAGSEEHRTEINRLLKHLSRYEHIKVCVSSRPWLIFEDAFGHDSMLRLQDLTKEDIRLYIEDEFEKNAHYQYFRRTDPQSCSQLQLELVKKSQGVFLWVYLVVLSLLRGFRNRDHVRMLRERLEQIPSDLDAFFKQMLTQIEPEYRPQSAAIFQVTMDVPDRLSLMTLSFLDEDKVNFGIDAPIKIASPSEVAADLETTAIRLKVRCKDFLEVHKIKNRGLFTTHYIDFLHRTVRDFLHTSDVEQILLSYPHRKEINSNAYQANALLAQIKMLDFQNDTTLSTVSEFVSLSRELMIIPEEYPAQRSSKILSELEKVLVEFHRRHRQARNILDAQILRSEASFATWQDEDSVSGIEVLLGYAARWNMQEFVMQTVGKNLPKLNTSLLSHAMEKDNILDTPAQQFAAPKPELIDFLLNLGENPNQKSATFPGQTVWNVFLERIPRPNGTNTIEKLQYYDGVRAHGDEALKMEMEPWLRTAEIMIRHGAARTLDGADLISYLREAFGAVEAARLETIWPRQTSTTSIERPLLKRLLHHFKPTSRKEKRKDKASP